MTELIIVAKMRPDGRVSIPKSAQEAGDLHTGDLLQIIIKKYPSRSAKVEVADPP